MLDPLLCCYIIVAMKHAGFVLNIAGLLRWAKLQGRAIRALGLPAWNGTATAAPGTLPRTGDRTPIGTQQELAEHMERYFAQNLARLESYVASMA